MPIKRRITDSGEKLYFSAEVKMLRKKRGITQEAMADKLSVSLKTLQNWENQKACPDTIESAFLLCDMLECDIEYIFGLQTLPRRVDADIHDETGLSQSAIQFLQAIKTAEGMKDTSESMTEFISAFLVDTSEDKINTVSQIASMVSALKQLTADKQYSKSTQGEVEIGGLYWKCQDCFTSFIKRQVQGGRVGG